MLWTSEQTNGQIRGGMRVGTLVGLCGVVLLVTSGCGESSGGEVLDRDEALSAGTQGVVHAVITTEPSDGAGPSVQDVYIDADRNRSFSQEFGPDGDLVRMVVIDDRTYREYLADSDWLIERTYDSEGEGALNELSEAVFGYKVAIENDALTSVESVGDSAAVRISIAHTGGELGETEFVVDLDSTSLFPTSATLRTVGDSSRDLAEISYDVDSLATMPEMPEMPTTAQTGTEAYTELAPDALRDFGEFPVYAPDSELLADHTPDVIHQETVTSEERSSVVSVYYWPPDVAQRERTVPDLQVSNVSASSIDASRLESSGETVSLSNGAKAVAAREGDALLSITWGVGETRVTVFGNLDVFSESQVREIAGSLKEAGT